MAQINLEEFTGFGKIKDIFNGLYNKDGLEEFMKNIVMSKKYDNGNNKMLADLSDIYVLIAKNDFPIEKVNATKDKKNITKTKNYVLGYIWLCHWVLEREMHKDFPYHFINFIDSRIPGLNIAEYMIEQFEQSETERLLLPYQVIIGAVNYWKKYFQKKFGIKNKFDLEKMISDFNLENEVNWNYLIMVL